MSIFNLIHKYDLYIFNKAISKIREIDAILNSKDPFLRFDQEYLIDLKRKWYDKLDKVQQRFEARFYRNRLKSIKKKYYL